MHPEAWVLGADTIVVAPGGCILGKPQDAGQARDMLLGLAGRSHQVLTACVLLAPGAKRAGSAVVVSRVCFRELEPSEIEAYLATGEPMDKAGAYAVQGRGRALIERVEGSFSNVVGLPLEAVERLLADAGLVAETDHDRP